MGTAARCAESNRETIAKTWRSVSAMTSRVADGCLLQPYWDLEEEAIHLDKERAFRTFGPLVGSRFNLLRRNSSPLVGKLEVI
jgi:hypothetical protein